MWTTAVGAEPPRTPAAPDMSTWDGNVHGPAGKTCAECHPNGHGSSNIDLIGDTIATPNSGTKTVIFTSLTGTNSHADGDGTYDGICEVWASTQTPQATQREVAEVGGDHRGGV